MEAEFDETKEALLGQQHRRGHSSVLVIGLLIITNAVTFVLAGRLHQWLWTPCQVNYAQADGGMQILVDTSCIVTQC